MIVPSASMICRIVPSLSKAGKGDNPIFCTALSNNDTMVWEQHNIYAPGASRKDLLIVIAVFPAWMLHLYKSMVSAEALYNSTNSAAGSDTGGAGSAMISVMIIRFP